jgi:hypothetical protein
MYSYCKISCTFNQAKVNMPYSNSLKPLKLHTLIRHILIWGAIIFTVYSTVRISKALS